VPEVEVAFGHTVLEGAKMQVNSSTIAFYETQLKRRLIASWVKLRSALLWKTGLIQTLRVLSVELT